VIWVRRLAEGCSLVLQAVALLENMQSQLPLNAGLQGAGVGAISSASSASSSASSASSASSSVASSWEAWALAGVESLMSLQRQDGSWG
jgi:hypothetical protein